MTLFCKDTHDGVNERDKRQILDQSDVLADIGINLLFVGAAFLGTLLDDCRVSVALLFVGKVGFPLDAPLLDDLEEGKGLGVIGREFGMALQVEAVAGVPVIKTFLLCDCLLEYLL